jgi:predicted small secreted protein
MKIDIKSLIIGALSALCLVLLIGAKSTPSQQNAPVSQDAPKKSVTEIIDLSGNKLRGTIVESSDTHIVLSIEGTDKTVRIPRGGIQSIEEMEVVEMNNYDIPIKELKENGRYQVAFAHGLGSGFEIVIDTRTGDVVRRMKTSAEAHMYKADDWTRFKDYKKMSK